MSAASLPPSRRSALAERIATEREAAQARVVALSRDFDAIVAASADSATDDEHDPEGATIAFERAQVAALLASARRSVADLDEAGERLRGDVYGTCERCGNPIPSERLMARPTARTCVGCA